jgi:hypothetical protein
MAWLSVVFFGVVNGVFWNFNDQVFLPQNGLAAQA